MKLFGKKSKRSVVVTDQMYHDEINYLVDDCNNIWSEILLQILSAYDRNDILSSYFGLKAQGVDPEGRVHALEKSYPELSWIVQDFA